MKKAVVVDSNEIKQILADWFKVPAENVIKSQYSYTIITDEDAEPGSR